MHKNFSDIRTEIARLVGLDDATYKTNIVKPYTQIAYEDILNRYNWPQLFEEKTIDTIAAVGTGTAAITESSATVTISGATPASGHKGRFIYFEGDLRSYRIIAVSGQDYTIDPAYAGSTDGTATYTVYVDTYNLPPDVQDIDYIVVRGAATRKLVRISPSRYFELNPGEFERNTPSHYWLDGSTVKNQPLTAGVVTVASSDTTDVSKVVTVRGEVGGEEDYEEITTDGSDSTTPVAGSKSFSVIYSGVKSTNDWVGRCTITTDSTATTVAIIAPELLHNNYQKLVVKPIPAVSERLRLSYYRRPMPLIRDADVPEQGMENLVFIGGAAMCFQERGQTKKAVVQYQLLEDRLSKTFARFNRHVDYEPTRQVDGDAYPMQE